VVAGSEQTGEVLIELASDHLSARRLLIAIANWNRIGGQLDFVDSTVLVEKDNGLFISSACISMFLLAVVILRARFVTHPLCGFRSG
jgi:hypothetical protein